MSIRFRPTLQALEDRSQPSTSGMVYVGQLPTETNTGMMGTMHSDGTASFYNATRDATTGTWTPQIVTPAHPSYVYAVVTASMSSGGTSGSPTSPPGNWPPGPPLPPLPQDRRAVLNKQFDELVVALNGVRPALFTAVVALNMAITEYYAAWRALQAVGPLGPLPAWQAAVTRFVNAGDNLDQTVLHYNGLVNAYNLLWVRLSATASELSSDYGINRLLPFVYEPLNPVDVQAIKDGRLIT